VNEPATVLLADDHAPTRAGVRAALEGHGFVVCAEAADAPSATVAAEHERPDVCLLDIRMPGGGITAAAAISALLPETAIVILTVSHDDADHIAQVTVRTHVSSILRKLRVPDRRAALDLLDREE
jgi:DNA-binding NarL/FixJ family response regulator